MTKVGRERYKAASAKVVRQICKMTKGALLALFSLTLILIVPLSAVAETALAGRSAAATARPVHRVTGEELARLKAEVDAEPSDAKLRYAYGDALKNSGRLKEAAREF